MVFDVTLVALFVRVTAADGITADDWSRTVPLTLAVLAWGHAGAASKAARQAQNNTFRAATGILIYNPPQQVQRMLRMDSKVTAD
jgi:hypothetical protein